MMKLQVHGQDDEKHEVEWQIAKGEVGSNNLSLPKQLECCREQHLVSQTKWEKCAPKQLTLKTIADDLSREASIRQRIRELENNLFDEYEEELWVVKQQYRGTQLKPG